MNLDRIFNAAYNGVQRGIMVKVAEFTEQQIKQEPWKSYWRGYHAGVTHRRMSVPDAGNLNKDFFLRGFKDARTKNKDARAKNKEDLYNKWKEAYKNWISIFKERAPEAYTKHLAWLEKPDVREHTTDPFGERFLMEEEMRASQKPKEESKPAEPQKPQIGAGGLPNPVNFGEPFTDYERRKYQQGEKPQGGMRKLQIAWREYFAQIHKYFTHFFARGSGSDFTVKYLTGKQGEIDSRIRTMVSNGIIQSLNELERIIRMIDSSKIDPTFLIELKYQLPVYKVPYIDKQKLDKLMLDERRQKLIQHTKRIFTKQS